MKKLLHFFLFLLLGWGSSYVAYAQQATIRGTVTDFSDGTPLEGATIALFKDGKGVAGAIADIEGDFQIKAAPSTYTLKISFYSFTTDSSTITLKPGELVVRKIQLVNATTSLGVVTITGESNAKTTNNAIRERINAINTIDAIASDLFTQLGANDAGDILKLVPSVTVSEGKYVNVRGLSDRYTATLVNMGEIPPLDPDRAAVQMDQFPAGLIDRITVIKNFTPDLPGNFTSGLVNIETKSDPQQLEISFRGSVGYNTASSLRNDFLTTRKGSLDFLGIDDGDRQVTLDDKNQGQPSFRRPLYDLVNSNSGLNQNYSFTIGNRFDILNRPFGFVIGLTYRYNEQDLADYEIGRYDFDIDGNSGNIDTTDGPIIDGRGIRSTTSSLAGAIVNLSFKPSVNHKIEVSYLGNLAGENLQLKSAGLSRGGSASDDNDLLINEVQQFNSRSLSTFQGRGKHTFGKSRLEWTLSQSKSVLDQPDRRVFFYIAPTQTTFLFDTFEVCIGAFCFDSLALRDTRVDTLPDRQIIAGSATEELGRRYRRLDQTTTDLNVDYTLPLNLWGDDPNRKLDLKMGGRYTRKYREFRDSTWAILASSVSGLNVQDTTGTIFENGGQLVAGEIETFIESGTANYSVQFPPGYAYKFNYDGFAGYLMGEFVPSAKLRIIGGVRYQTIEMALDGFSRPTLVNPEGKTLDSISIANGTFFTDDFLPALNLIYRPTENMNVRLGYARTIAIPSFREVAVFVNNNFRGDYRTAGNPKTRRSVIDNIDLRYEWSPKPGAIFSIGGFYKEILGPIELVFQSDVLTEFVNLRTGTDSGLVAPINPIIPKPQEDEFAEELGDLAVALAYGVEFEVRTDFGFIGKGWDKLRLWGNYALIRTEVPLDQRSRTILIRQFSEQFESEGLEIPTRRRLYGQPTFSVNAEVSYVDRDNLGLDVSVNYNQFGDRLVLVLDGGTNIVEKSRGVLNVTVRKTIDKEKRFAVRFRARNLLDPEYKRTYQLLGLAQDFQTFENYRIGRTYSLGVSYDF
ncbi:MAG: TonB-dependent receptor [Bacteroidota bacterium]